MGLPEHFNPITTRFEWAIAPFVRPPSWEINGPVVDIKLETIKLGAQGHDYGKQRLRVEYSGSISISIVICPHVKFQGGAHSKCRDEMSDHRGET